MKIEIASLEDAQELVEIYRYYVEKTAITFEYEVPSVEEFKQRMVHVLVNIIYVLNGYVGAVLILFMLWKNIPI